MKLALAQLNPIIGDLEGNAEKIFDVCKSIKHKDIDLVIPHQASGTAIKAYSKFGGFDDSKVINIISNYYK